MNRSFIFFISVLLSLGFAGGSFAVHTEIPAETASANESGEGAVQAFRPSPEFYRVQALINLLVRKGIITEEELKKEILGMKKTDK